MERLFIGGEYVESVGGGEIAVEDPATEEIIAVVPDASAEDVDRAVHAAREAQPAWRRTDALERAELLHRCAERLAAAADELAVLLTREGGKTLKENRDEVDWSVTAIRHLAEVARTSRGRVVGATKPDQLNLVLNEPYGVVVHILPFNYPLVLLAWQVPAALAAGNTCIVKPAEQTPLATLKLGEIFSCLPPGVFNVVTATGPGSARLVEHPGGLDQLGERQARGEHAKPMGGEQHEEDGEAEADEQGHRHSLSGRTAPLAGRSNPADGYEAP